MVRRSAGHTQAPEPAGRAERAGADEGIPVNRLRTGATDGIRALTEIFPPGMIRLSPMERSFAEARRLKPMIVSALAPYLRAIANSVSPRFTVWITPSVGGIVSP